MASNMAAQIFNFKMEEEIYSETIYELKKEIEELKKENEAEKKRLKRENYVLMAICLGNYNGDEFKELVLKDVGDRSIVREMMRGGKDCGVMEGYFFQVSGGVSPAHYIG